MCAAAFGYKFHGMNYPAPPTRGATTRDTTRIAAFAALIAALGILPLIPVPVIPVPITAQTLGVMLAGGVLGPKRGALAVALFLLGVALGLPLLAGGRGGLGAFLAPGGGFLLGWILGAAVIGVLTPRRGAVSLVWQTAVCLLGGIGAVYAVGVPWMAVVAGLPIPAAAVAALAFVPGDILKACLAAAALRTLRRALPAAT